MKSWFSIGAVCFTACIYLGYADNEMDDFINECNMMIETMDHCGQGWMNLEQEMIDSVNSFADRIVYTESLIEDEANQIVVMAGRIVETEALMIDVIEACDCRNDTGSRSLKDGFNNNEQHPFMSLESKPLHIGNVAHKRQDLSVSHCEPMESLVEVMDACLETFTVYNDDFLAVLSYMDQAINDMGDRIVDTECMIMNMSYQIGSMSNRIVVVEEMMFNATEECCGGKTEIKSAELKSLSSYSSKSSLAMNDDLISHCKQDPSKKTFVTDSGKKSVLLRLSRNLFRDLEQKFAFISSLLPKFGNDTQKALVTNKAGNPMPCDTWWNPFCCASEVCADILAQMIKDMANGADAMQEICEDIIDEIGKLADDIVKTEEDILDMGLKIGDMSDCIVVFIDEGMSFMVQYCPTGRSQYYHTVTSSNTCTLSTTRRGFTVESLELKKRHLEAKYKRLLETSIATMNVSKLKDVQEFVSPYLKSGDNPFGEFTAMVESCIQVMNDMTDLITSQYDYLNRLFNSMSSLSTKTVQMMTSVTAMSHSVDDLEDEVGKENTLMNRLTHCHDN